VKAFALALIAIFVFAVSAQADPGPGDEVVVIPGDCHHPTLVSAHNTQQKTLHYLIRIDSRLVEEGTLAVDARVSHEYSLPGRHFYRIRLGLAIDHVYFSDEGWGTGCDPTPPPTTPPPTTPPPTTPPPTTPPPTTHTTTTPPPPTTTPPAPCTDGDCHRHTAHTGGGSTPLVLGAAALALLILGAVALRIGSKRGA
jgi:hypothetical protein